MLKKHKVKMTVLPPGPDVNRFQEAAHEWLLGKNHSVVDSHHQRPRVTLEEFLANRLEVAAEILRRRS